MSTAARLNYADFAARVGTDFVLHLPAGDRAALVLTECTLSGSESFSLIFKAASRAPAEQGIYQVAAPDFGPEPIFVVPIAERPDDSQYPLEYQAIFNSVPTLAASA